MNDINDRYNLHIDKSKQQMLGLQIKSDIDRYARKMMLRASIIGSLIILSLITTHLTLSAIDGAHAEWMHNLVLIVMGISGYIAVAVIAEAREKKRIVTVCIESLLKTGHVKNDNKGDEHNFEEILEELYATKQNATPTKAYLLILAMYAPDHLIVNRPNMETSHATINYYAPSHHHMCFSTNREEFYRFYAKRDEHTLELA